MHKLLLHLISDNNGNKILFGSSNCIAIMLVNILQGSNLFLNCKGKLLNPRKYQIYVRCINANVWNNCNIIFDVNRIMQSNIQIRSKRLCNGKGAIKRFSDICSYIRLWYFSPWKLAEEYDSWIEIRPKSLMAHNKPKIKG